MLFRTLVDLSTDKFCNDFNKWISKVARHVKECKLLECKQILEFGGRSGRNPKGVRSGRKFLRPLRTPPQLVIWFVADAKIRENTKSLAFHFLVFQFMNDDFLMIRKKPPQVYLNSLTSHLYCVKAS